MTRRGPTLAAFIAASTRVCNSQGSRGTAGYRVCGQHGIERPRLRTYTQPAQLFFLLEHSLRPTLCPLCGLASWPLLGARDIYAWGHGGGFSGGGVIKRRGAFLGVAMPGDLDLAEDKPGRLPLLGPLFPVPLGRRRTRAPWRWLAIPMRCLPMNHRPSGAGSSGWRDGAIKKEILSRARTHWYGPLQ